MNSASYQADHSEPKVHLAATDRVGSTRQFYRAEEHPLSNPAWSACAPSPLTRSFREADALLHDREMTPVGLVRFCIPLVLDLQLHFDLENAPGALPALQKSAPQLKAAINCFLATQAVLLAEGRRLLRVAAQEAGSPARHRELNQTFTRLRDDFYAHEGGQMQFVQRAYGLDTRETD